MPAAPENSLALSCEIEHREITAWRLHFWVCTQEKFSHVCTRKHVKMFMLLWIIKPGNNPNAHWQENGSIKCAVCFSKSGILYNLWTKCREACFCTAHELRMVLTILKGYLKEDDTTDTIYSLQSLKYLLFCPFTEKVCYPLIYSYMRTIWMSPSGMSSSFAV